MADDAESDLLGSLAAHLGEGHRPTIGVLIAIGLVRLSAELGERLDRH